MSRGRRSQADTNKADKWKNRMANEIMCKAINHEWKNVKCLQGFKLTLISKVIWMLLWTV